MGWLGVVETPNGGTGVTLGSFGISTSNLVTLSTASENRNTRGSESNLDDKHFFADGHAPDTFFVRVDETTGGVGVSSLNAILLTDQLGRDSNPSCSTDGHAIQTSEKAALFVQGGDGATLGNVIVDHDAADQSKIGKSGSTIDGSSVPVSDIDVSRYLAAPGGNRTITDLQLLDLDELAFQDFPTFSGFSGEAIGPIEANFLIGVVGAAGLSQG